MFHIVINYCNNLKLKGVKVSAPGNSPNTDGIHVQMSTGVSIVGTKMGIKNRVSELYGETNYSIGSLGKDAKEAGV